MARTPGWSVFLLAFLLLPRDSLQGRHQRKLLDKLLKNYNILERPVLNDSDALTVNLGVTLQQIIDVDEKNQILTTNIWVRMIWTDEYLSWNESEFGGLNQIRLDPKRIWVPDILMYNRFSPGPAPTKAVGQTPEELQHLGASGKYFATTLCMVAGSVVLTVLTLNFHHRSPETSRMSRATRKVLLEWLPRLLCMPTRREEKSEDGRDRSRDTLRTDNISMNSFKTMEELSSHNLLASMERREVGHDFPLQAGHDFPPGLSNDLSPRLPRTFPAALPASGFNIPVSSSDDSALHCNRAAPRTSAEGQLILKELRYITNHFRDKAEDDKMSNEWRYAAMTVDRLCLWIFAVFTLVTTGTILMSAPHILQQVRDFFVGLAGKGAV
ncbi:PREDICTED: neuronal acetylcholine receptor subunit alpha-7-like [Branchiostoma belcheri]|uniref:Neuronal acetylcholine receptor subunit alpha-7-like n=1 Tax=Branchiostoma belcheri TaxID=7741 RepID=A0A6P4Z6B5_BRABE|nr:PREDICTED: neuronal acetylcholine receptor subunit alpha-7-like [Branchiostoma belcheri]